MPQAGSVSRSGAAFFSEHGRPETAVSDGKDITFWPDEWRKVLDGDKAVGNSVQVFIPLDDQNVGVGVWRCGRVIEYNSEEDRHKVLLDPTEGTSNQSAAVTSTNTVSSTNGSKANNSSNTAPQGITREADDTIKVSLDECRYVWCDDGQKGRSNVGKKTPSVHGHLQLDYSKKDVGEFCRVWWSRYQRFYYGRIISYSPSTKEHQITYEDGDTRSYDMSSKIYEIIPLPASFALSNAKDDVGSAQLVSAWHSKMLAKKIETDSAAQDLVLKSQSQSTTADSDVAATRPAAYSSLGASMHHFDVINAYFAEVSE